MTFKIVSSRPSTLDPSWTCNYAVVTPVTSELEYKVGDYCFIADHTIANTSQQFVEWSHDYGDGSGW